MKSCALLFIALAFAAPSFAQSSDDPDVQHLDSLGAQLDSLPDNGTLLHAMDSLTAEEPSSDESTILQLGKNDLSAGRIQEALKEFDKAVQLVPDDPRALALKGKALTKLGRHSEALPSLSRAIELDPNLTETRMDRAAAYSLMNNPEAALQDLQSAIAADTTLKSLARSSSAFRALYNSPAFQKLVR